MSFTLVFEGDVRARKLNPLTTDTPFGVPCGAGVGDSMSEAFLYFEALQQIESCSDLAEAQKIAADALAKAGDTLAAELQAPAT